MVWNKRVVASGLLRALALIALSLTSLFASCKKECGTPLTAERFIEAQESRRWELTCEAMWTCPRDRQVVEAVVGTYPSLEACKAHHPPRFLQGVPQVLAGIEAGRLRFDPARARSCLKWWDARTARDLCNQKPLDVSGCEGVLVAQLSRGAPCALDAECAGDLECFGAKPEGGASDCHGTCRAARHRRCGDAICELDEYCDRAEPGGKLVCKPRVAEGEDCFTKHACSPGTSAPDGRSEFAAGAILCNRLRDDPERRRGVCTAIRSLDESEACESNIFCKPGLHCVDHTCQRPALSAEGESCDSIARCGPGLVCFDPFGESGGTCGKPRTDGEPCRPTHQCEPHLTCDVETGGAGKCTPRRPAGEPCDTPWSCQSFICEEGRCLDPVLCIVPESGESDE